MRSTPALIVLAAALWAPALYTPALGAAQAQAPTAPLPELTVPAPAAVAQPTTAPTDAARTRAKELFERGVIAYEGARYPEALASFQEAFRLRPHPLVRVNIANCYDKLGKPLEALFHFEQFLASDVASPAQRQEVVAATERLRKQLGAVLLRVSPDGALATVDRGEQRRTPLLDALQLPAGDHMIEVRLDGYQTAQRNFTVYGGSTMEIDVVLEPVGSGVLAVVPAGAAIATPPVEASAAPKPPAPAKPKASADESTTPTAEVQLPTHVWVLGGLSVAMLASATITGILALGAESDYDRYSTLRRDAQAPLAQQANYDDAIAAADRADTLAAVTDVLLVGSLATATAAIIFAVMDDGERTEPSATLTPTLGPERASLTLRTRF